MELKINLVRHQDNDDLDPVLCEVMKLLYFWANNEGLQGRRCTSFSITGEINDDPNEDLYKIQCFAYPVKEITE